MKNTDLEIIGKMIKEKRRSIKWSQQRLAELAGVNRSTVDSIEKGSDVTFSRMRRVAYTLSIRLSDIEARIYYI